MHAKVRVAVRRSGVSEWTAYQLVGRRGWRGDDGVIESSSDANGRVAVATSGCLRVAGCLREGVVVMQLWCALTGSNGSVAEPGRIHTGLART